MRLDSFDSLDKMSEKDLLKLIVSNQMYLLHRFDAFENKYNGEKTNSSDVVIDLGLDKAGTFLKQIDVSLKKNFTEE